MITDINSEDRLIQKTFVDYLCLSTGDGTVLERLNLASKRLPEMVPVGPG
jgi:hypothetical protein